jgi:general secretion pathway protein C
MGSDLKTGYAVILIRILLVFLAAKLLWFVLEIVWFPTAGVTHKENRHVKPLYYRVKLTRQQVKAPPKKVQKPIGNIKDIKLIALYHASDATVVTVMYKSKTKVLGKGDTVNGFVLENAGSDFAVFSKKGKMYKVTFVKPKRKGYGTIEAVPSANSHLPEKTSVSEESQEGEIIDAGDHKIIDRAIIERYTKNMNEIYQNIGILEIKKEGKIDGFRITFVKKGTPFSELGLRRGDILKKINGQELDSYQAAFEAYKNIGNVQNVTLSIERGNKTMELEYEIN